MDYSRTTPSPKRERSSSLLGLPEIHPEIDPSYFPLANHPTPTHLSEFWNSFSQLSIKRKKLENHITLQSSSAVQNIHNSSTINETVGSSPRSATVTTPLTPYPDNLFENPSATVGHHPVVSSSTFPDEPSVRNHFHHQQQSAQQHHSIILPLNVSVDQSLPHSATSPNLPSPTQSPVQTMQLPINNEHSSTASQHHQSSIYHRSHPFNRTIATPTVNTFATSFANSNIQSRHNLSSPSNLPIDMDNIGRFIHDFEGMPELGKSYLMMHLLRRCPLPTLQFVTTTAMPALKRDIFTSVPLEVSYQILKYLDIKSVAKCAQVSKTWSNIVLGEGADTAIWKLSLIRNGWSKESYAASLAGLDKKPRTLNTDQQMPEIKLEHSLVHPYRKNYEQIYKIEKNWELGRCKTIYFPAHAFNVVTCLQADSEKVVSGSDDTNIHIFDINTGELKGRLCGHDGGVWALEYSDYTLVSGSTDRTVRVWDMEEQRCTHIFDGHTSTVRCLLIMKPQYNPETKCYEPAVPLIVTGSRDSTLRIWRLPNPRSDKPYFAHPGTPNQEQKNPYHLHTLTGHANSVRAIAGSHHVLVSGSYDNTVRVWDVLTGECRWHLRGHREKVYAVGYCHALKRCASGSLDSTVKIWSTETGEMLFNLEGHTSLVGLLELSEKFLISAAADASLRIWDPITGQCYAHLRGHTNAITCVNHNIQLNRLVSGSETGLKLWELESKTLKIGTKPRNSRGVGFDVVQTANGPEPARGRFLYDFTTRVNGVWRVHMDDRRLVSAVQRENGKTWIEILDFGDFEHLGEEIQAPGDETDVLNEDTAMADVTRNTETMSMFASGNNPQSLQYLRPGGRQHHNRQMFPRHESLPTLHHDGTQPVEINDNPQEMQQEVSGREEVLEQNQQQLLDSQQQISGASQTITNEDNEHLIPPGAPLLPSTSISNISTHLRSSMMPVDSNATNTHNHFNELDSSQSSTSGEQLMSFDYGTNNSNIHSGHHRDNRSRRRHANHSSSAASTSRHSRRHGRE